MEESARLRLFVYILLIVKHLMDCISVSRPPGVLQMIVGSHISSTMSDLLLPHRLIIAPQHVVMASMPTVALNGREAEKTTM
ncbi:hypothetical protein EYF80_016098 [Liparis tanakae]|uniref:Secreted protein n=1 Tax=Liparis tanakae TaxID=230148 RepID=A0A4Z2I6Z6_9TELE|nr:hypothetical protein EYF80_016098 [Liparis tanakae]